MITTIRKGYTVEIEGESYTVLGSQKLRGTQYYVLRGAQGRVSCRRSVILEGQNNGSITVKG